MRCLDVIHILEQLSPKAYALDWDNVGLLVGDDSWEVHKIMIALDATEAVVQEAVKQKVDMLITHHPMLFRGVKQVSNETSVGRKILQLAEHRIACYAMHTNFDVKGSMADLAAERLHLSDCKVLEVTMESDGVREGIGRVGELVGQTPVSELVKQVKEAFDLDTVMLYGDLDAKVKRVAICPGSGKSVVKDALRHGAEILITGDFGHHEGLDALDDGLQIIDATHYGLESIFIAFMEQYVREQLPELECVPLAIGCPFRYV